MQLDVQCWIDRGRIDKGHKNESGECNGDTYLDLWMDVRQSIGGKYGLNR